jgi:hypothetical protein
MEGDLNNRLQYRSERAGTHLPDEVANTSETSVNFYQTTWRNIPEDSHLQPQVSSSLIVENQVSHPHT